MARLFDPRSIAVIGASDDLLGSLRGRAAAPLANIGRDTHRLAKRFAADPSVRQSEVNPLVSDTKGRAFALDARVWRDESATSS